MDVGSIEKLTERQRECLRLVLRHYTSKEMARELGIGVDAVDQRLKSAMRKLGVATRLEAARMLAAYEGQGAHDLRPPAVQPPVRPARSVRSRIGALLRPFKRLLPRARRGRFVLAACLAGIAFGMVEMGLPLDLYLRDRTIAAYRHPVSGDITVIDIDRKSVEGLGQTPWPRRYLTQMFRRLDQMGAAKVVYGLQLSRHMDAREDRELARQLQSMGGRVTLLVDIEGDPQSGTPRLPLPEFRTRAVLGHGLGLAVLSTARFVPKYFEIGGRSYPSAALEMAGVYPPGGSSWAGLLAGVTTTSFPIDYSIDIRTIRTFSALDLVEGKVPDTSIDGKVVAIVASNRSAAQTVYAPGIGNVDISLTYVLAAETLIQGVPTEVPWRIIFLPAVLLVIIAGWLRSPLFSAIGLSCGIVMLLCLPSLLLPHKIYVDVTPALFLLALVGIVFTWVFVRRRLAARALAKAAT